LAVILAEAHAVERELTKVLAEIERLKVAPQRYGDGPGSTHWDECWKSHHGCAIAKIERDASTSGKSP